MLTAETLSILFPLGKKMLQCIMDSLTSQHETLFLTKWYHTPYRHSAGLFYAKMENNMLFSRSSCFTVCSAHAYLNDRFWTLKCLIYSLQTLKSMWKVVCPSLCPTLICSPGLLNFSCPLPLPPSFVCEALGLRDHDGLVRDIAAARAPSLVANAPTMACSCVREVSYMTVLSSHYLIWTCTNLFAVIMSIESVRWHRDTEKNVV